MIEVQDVWFTYDGKRYVLKDISMKIGKGQYVAIMGENGAGKSTLIKHFNGLLKPSRGEVHIDGLNVSESPTSSLSKKIALVFQYPESMFFSETVYKEVAFGLKNLGFSEKTIKTQVMRFLTLFGLEAYTDRSPFTLSSGEQRRLAFSCVLAWKPEYIVLDEPTAGQDRYQRELLKGMIEQLVAQGNTVIAVSHDIEFIAETAPRVFLMTEGEIISEGYAKKILSDEELLSLAGLVLPQITEVFHRLEEIDLPRDVMYPREAAAQIMKLLWGGRIA